MATPADFPLLDLSKVAEIIQWAMDAEEILSMNENYYFVNRFPTAAPVEGRIKWQLYEWNDDLPYIVEPGSTAEAPVTIPRYGEEEYAFNPMRWEEKHELNEQIINGLRRPGTLNEKYGTEYVTRLGQAFRKKDIVFKELMAWLAVSFDGFEYYEERPGKKAYENVSYGVNVAAVNALDYWDVIPVAPTPGGGPAIMLRNWLRSISERTGWSSDSVQILMNDVTRRAFVDHPESQALLPVNQLGYGNLDDIRRKIPEIGQFTIFDGKYKIVYELTSNLVAPAGPYPTTASCTLERTFGLKVGDPFYLKDDDVTPNESSVVYVNAINPLTKTVTFTFPVGFTMPSGAPYTYLANHSHIRGYVKYLQDGQVTLLPPGNIGSKPLMEFVPAYWGIKSDYSQYSGLNIDVWEDRIEPGKKQWIRMADSGLWAIYFAQYIYTWKTFAPK
jgi:hypothetical protein